MSRFPDFATEGVDTRELRAKAPLFVVVWQPGCPTCRYAMPYYQRLQDKYPEAAVVGVSQDDAATTEAYCRDNGLTFPQVGAGLEVSRLFKPRTVPTYVLTDDSGEEVLSGEAWNLDDLNLAAKYIGEAVGEDRGPVVGSSEDVLRFKPG